MLLLLLLLLQGDSDAWIMTSSSKSSNGRLMAAGRLKSTAVWIQSLQ